MSLYLPSGTNIDRLDHKFKFMDDFQNYINEQKQTPNLIILHNIWGGVDFMILCATKYHGFYLKKIMAWRIYEVW
jgi:hypothetical protein